MELDEFIELVKEQQGIDLSGVLTTADKIGRPERALDRDAFDDFNKRNPMAGGGMLVQPSADGSRPGYAKDKKGHGQDAAPLTKEQKKNIKLYNKNVEKYGGVKFEDIPNTGKGNADKRYGIKTGKITGTGYDFDRSKIDYRESAAYKKSITPKGYISSTELFELIDNPKLKSGNFQQARKFERNPTKYPGKKNYVYNYIKKLLNEKQVGKAGSKSLAAQKFFYRKPTKAELDKINSFIDSRILETGTVDNVKIFHKEFGELFKGKKTKGFFNDTLSLDKARAALKKYGINATDSQLARAMMRLGQIYDGHTFQNEINIPKNKSAGKFIEKSFNELDIYNGWRSASYDAAMDDINKVMAKSAGDIRSFKYTLNNYIKENYPQIFKNYDVNEIFSLTTSSVRGSYPYAYFIDLTKNDINQKALSSFQGKASIAEGKIQKAITNFRRTGNKKFYDEAVRVADVFNNKTRKNFLSDERIIKVGGVNALKLEIGSQQQIKDKIGFASEYYKNNNLKKWKDQGIDIDAHTAKSGYIKTFDSKTPPRGVATFGDIIQDGKVNEKQFKNLVATLGGGKCGTRGFLNQGGRVGLKDGPVNLDVCFRNGLERIRKGGVDFTRAEAMNFNKLTKGLRAIGASNIMKFGVIPEALFEGALIADKMASEGDSFMQGLRNSYLAIPFQAMGMMKTYEEGRRDEILAAAPESQKEQVRDVFNMQDSLNRKNQLRQEIFNLQEQKKQTDAISDGSFGYVGDTQDLDNIILKKRQELEGLYDDPRSKLGKVSRDEKLLTGSPLDLNIKDQLTMDAYKSAVEKADADRASNILFAPGAGLGVDTQIKERMKKLPITPEYAKEQLQATGDFFGMGYTPYGMNQLFTLMGREDPRFGYDETGKYNEEKGLNDYINYLRTLNFAEKFRDEKAGGGIAGLSGGDPEGAMTRSMNPDSQGLSYLFNRVKKA